MSSKKRQRPDEAEMDPFYRPYEGESVLYLEGKVEWGDDGRLIDENGFAVMMRWETPLMEAHAAYICGQGGEGLDDNDIVEHRGQEKLAQESSVKAYLNVGFGMGLVDTAIESHRIRNSGGHWKHVIVEAHPEVYKKALDFAQKVNTETGNVDSVIVLHGKWQVVDIEVTVCSP